MRITRIDLFQVTRSVFGMPVVTVGPGDVTP